MKFNATVALTLILLTMMFGAGFVSAMWGFTVGHEALKGVTQPDIRPSNKLPNGKQTNGTKEGLDMLREEEILSKIKVQLNSKTKNPKVSKNKSENQDDSDSNSEKKKQKETESKTINFPITSQDKGVTLAVISSSQEGDSLLLKLNMKNQGSAPVRFLYSFLNVTDDKGQALSVITEGLPGELPANGEEFTGTVSIPKALSNDSQKLSLTLTDYPDQKLQLKIVDIPVAR